MKPMKLDQHWFRLLLISSAVAYMIKAVHSSIYPHISVYSFTFGVFTLDDDDGPSLYIVCMEMIWKVFECPYMSILASIRSGT